MPDIFVPQDTIGISSYLLEVSNKELIPQFCFQYTDQNRERLKQFEDYKALQEYLNKQNIVETFIRFASSKGVKRRNILIQKSHKLLERNLLAGIIYNMLNMDQYIQFLNQTDNVVLKAVEVLEKGEAFPVAPEKENITAQEENEQEERTA